MPSMRNTVILIILDGWGYNPDNKHNAIAIANTPQWDTWWSQHPNVLLQCSGEVMGLPEGQMGNSEVGHMHIGAGRTIEQDYTRINQAIERENFFRHEVLISVIHDTFKMSRAIHVLGLLSPGGVHSHEKHIHALLKCLYQQNVRADNPNTPVYLHLFLDGRDTSPRSASVSLDALDRQLKQFPSAQIKSVIGRYYAMDRDARWDRVKCAYDLITLGKGSFQENNALDALEKAYARNENDEFVQATCIGQPISMQDGDTVIFMNFRSDRTRQLSRALVLPSFDGFSRDNFPALSQFVTLTHYANDIPSIELFPPAQLKNTLGECVSNAGFTQLRIAETEKYAHVTFFLNGGIEQPFLNEDRVLVSSPHVTTYDLQPSMSAVEIKDRIVDDILSQRHDLIIANFANADMVGHTGNMDATIQAIECLDQCLQEIGVAAKKVDAEIVITADHGNAECMFDDKTGQKHTAHTSDPVPFLYIGKSTISVLKGENFSLIDVAPTILHLLDLPIPEDMQGKSIVESL
jgi:2,3-bisphosphoglycerate-independent phosphoglycerate mutase